MKVLFLFLVIILFKYQGNTQIPNNDEYRYKVTYELSYQPDSTDLKSTLSEPMVLYIGDKISRFSSLGQAVRDSLRDYTNIGSREQISFQQLRELNPPTKFSYRIFKNIPSEKVYFAERIVRDNLIYIENLPLMEWEIEPETKEIAGYKVQKASTIFGGRKYTAWFTAEIPITDGPYKFSGLPGLIIELSDEKKEYNFKLTNFQKLDSSLEVKFDPKDHVTVDKNEFLKIKKNYDRNPLAALERGGRKINFSPEQEREALKEIRENFEKNNNPIELE